jgi:hypothetical protein
MEFLCARRNAIFPAMSAILKEEGFAVVEPAVIAGAA